ncbi:murein hydrolase activator EnvC family protein [Sphingomonas sp.]|jgi:murein DD-endopeptidase MepM/ murein hydrolase activator NlpD|uniref:murein hydrolase activator EnvC family protein n=1 Tax=Sphingomonas sp. TaxID=28214 RepID=UPI002D81167A|nr:peptidoglycan DD-metalloendopeptidase family protein [Sphingomonas sp.]HEU0043901.1 peptidoglycan DD-metalloendopeptidase family protein [Sphingomonas sp.]
MRRLLLLVAIGALIGATPLPDVQRRLADAKRDAAVAATRAAELEAAAAREQDAARQAQVREAALATTVAGAEARVRGAEARVELVAQAQAQAQARLAQSQAPAARLLAALTGLARRPTIAAVAQPGSVDDLVHVRAVLGAALPVVRERSASVRIELNEVRRLQAQAELAAQALRDSRAQLERDRVALAQLEARHRAQATAFTQRALSEADRALALGERARDLVDRLAVEGQAKVTVAELEGLPGPLPRPLAPGVWPTQPPEAYRLPVTGRLVTGFGEVSDAGVRSRGLTFQVAPDTPVTSPATGVVRYAQPFRGYGTIIVIDHADGWTTLVTGLSGAAVRSGQPVVTGDTLGHAALGEEPQVTVELRRRGRPIDIAGLIG